MGDTPSREHDPALRSTLRRLGAYVFLFDALLGYAIYLAWFSLNGLSDFEIGTLLALWSGSALFVEILTGAVSDRADRRIILAIAPLFKIVTFVLWPLADGNYVLFATGFVFWTLGESLYSGTREAVLYEHLDRAGQQDRFEYHYGRQQALQSLGVGAGLALGGLVASASIPAALWLSVPPLLVCSWLATGITDARSHRLPDTAFADAHGQQHTIAGHVRNAIAGFRRIPALRPLTLYIAAGLCLLEELEEFDQLFYLAVSLPLALFGIAGAVGLGFEALASAFASRLPARRHLAWLLPLAGGLLLLLASRSDSPWIVIVLELAYVVVAPAAVLAEARYQHLIDGDSRATGTSVLVFLQNIVAMLLALAIGLAAEWLGILPAYGLAGGWLLVVAVVSGIAVLRGQQLT